jgi:hypothetical protein
LEIDVELGTTWLARYNSGHTDFLTDVAVELGVSRDDSLAIILHLRGTIRSKTISHLRSYRYAVDTAHSMLPRVDTASKVNSQIRKLDSETAAEILKLVYGMDIAVAAALVKGDSGFNLGAFLRAKTDSLDTLRKLIDEGLPAEPPPSLWEHLE